MAGTEGRRLRDDRWLRLMRYAGDAGVRVPVVLGV